MSDENKVVDLEEWKRAQSDRATREEIEDLQEQLNQIMHTFDLTPQPYFMSLEEMLGTPKNLTHHTMELGDVVDSLTESMIALDRLGHPELGEKVSDVLSTIFFRLDDEDV